MQLIGKPFCDLAAEIDHEAGWFPNLVLVGERWRVLTIGDPNGLPWLMRSSVPANAFPAIAMLMPIDKTITSIAPNRSFISNIILSSTGPRGTVNLAWRHCQSKMASSGRMAYPICPSEKQKPRDRPTLRIGMVSPATAPVALMSPLGALPSSPSSPASRF